MHGLSTQCHNSDIGRWRQEDQECKTSLGHIVNSKSGWALGDPAPKRESGNTSTVMNEWQRHSHRVKGWEILL